MNLQLANPSAQDFPESIEAKLEDGIAVTSMFNRKGSLLAVGCNDGRVVVWDFDTHGITRMFSGHVQRISALSWSRNGRYLLSASGDWHVIIWDVLSSEKKASYKFDGPVLAARLHPRNDNVFIACPMLSAPIIVDMTKPEPECRQVIDLPEDEIAPQKGQRAEQGVIAVFTKKGEKIYAGTPRGNIIIIDTTTRTKLKEISVATGTQTGIKSIAFSQDGSAYIVNSMDRNIRVYRTDSDVCEHTFSDVVNHVQWKTCCFSAGRGDFIIGGSAEEAQHHIYIWDRHMGQLLRILEGPRTAGGLLDCVWHPQRPIIASISMYGLVFIWTVNSTENWSAFAPDFKELEDNEEYIEREDEFDYVDVSKVKHEKREEEQGIIDIMTVEDEVHFGSSDEEPIDDELVYLPIDVLADAEGEVESDDEDDKEPLASAAIRASEQPKKRSTADTQAGGASSKKKSRSNKRR